MFLHVLYICMVLLNVVSFVSFCPLIIKNERFKMAAGFRLIEVLFCPAVVYY